MYYGKHTGKIDCPLFLRESNKEITCAIEENYLSAKKFQSREERKNIKSITAVLAAYAVMVI